MNFIHIDCPKSKLTLAVPLLIKYKNGLDIYFFRVHRQFCWLQIFCFCLKPGKQGITFAYIGVKYSFAASCRTAQSARTINPPPSLHPITHRIGQEGKQRAWRTGWFIAGQATQFSVWFNFKRDAMTAKLNL